MPGKTCSWIEGGRFGRRDWKGHGSEKGRKLMKLVQIVEAFQRRMESCEIIFIWEKNTLSGLGQVHQCIFTSEGFTWMMKLINVASFRSRIFSQSLSSCFFLVLPALSCLIGLIIVIDIKYIKMFVLSFSFIVASTCQQHHVGGLPIKWLPPAGGYGSVIPNRPRWAWTQIGWSCEKGRGSGGSGWFQCSSMYSMWIESP